LAKCLNLGVVNLVLLLPEEFLKKIAAENLLMI
jgi:hypothetical protein